MIRSLRLMIHAGVIIALALWAMMQNGDVRIAWDSYTLETNLGVFLLSALALAVALLFLYRLWLALLSVPQAWAKRRAARRQILGMRSLARGLNAVAMGDAAAADKQAARALRYLPTGQPLPLLLRAQAARLNGRVEDATRYLVDLSESRDAGFLGLRGLLQGALEANDLNRALVHARRAMRLYPDKPWITRSVYELEVRLKEWESALRTLDKARPDEMLTAAKIKADKAALLVLRGDEAQNTAAGPTHKAGDYYRQALKLDRGFVPAALRLARLYQKQDKRGQAVRVIESTWRQAPHPDLAAVWPELIAPRDCEKPLKVMKWSERLARHHPGHGESALLLARSALNCALWGEAREYLKLAEKASPDRRAYEMLAECAALSGEGESRRAEYLQKAAKAQLPPRWICNESGVTYRAWQPLSEPQGAFNTIYWQQGPDRPEQHFLPPVQRELEWAF